MTAIVVHPGSNAPVGTLDILWGQAPPDEEQRNDAFVKALLFAQFIELVDGPVAGPGGRPIDLPGPETQRSSSIHWQAVQAPRDQAWWTVRGTGVVVGNADTPVRGGTTTASDGGRRAVSEAAHVRRIQAAREKNKK